MKSAARFRPITFTLMLLSLVRLVSAATLTWVGGNLSHRFAIGSLAVLALTALFPLNTAFVQTLANALDAPQLNWTTGGNQSWVGQTASAEASILTESPKRSSSCGRSAPSSGFIVPTSRKRASLSALIPSRSTRT